MYSELRSLLREADGRNEWVAAINVDIRSFSASTSGDPAQTALYLRTVYGKMLDGYFVDATFAKPTGDGLLLVIPFPPVEDALAAVSRTVVSDALRLDRDFHQFAADEPLLRFPHPNAVGIGLSFGSVARLMTGDVTLDYTGRALNVASRLMDLARPRGVVAEVTLDVHALDSDTLKCLAPDRVYVKGFAEPLEILYTKDVTQIPDRYRQPPLPAKEHCEPLDRFTRTAARRRGRHRVRLSREPSDRTQIKVNVTYPNYSKRRGRWIATEDTFSPEFTFLQTPDGPHIELEFRAIATELERLGVAAGVEAGLRISFPVAVDETA